MNIRDDYFSEKKPRPATDSSGSEENFSDSTFHGCKVLSAQDFSDFEHCDEFTVDEMLRDGWEKLTDEKNVQAWARDFGDSGLKQVHCLIVWILISTQTQLFATQTQV